MKQAISDPSVPSERARYRDAELSDNEVEALMEYFRVTTYKALTGILAAMRKSGLGI